MFLIVEYKLFWLTFNVGIAGFEPALAVYVSGFRAQRVANYTISQYDPPLRIELSSLGPKPSVINRYTIGGYVFVAPEGIEP